MPNKDDTIKIVVVGDGAVGKTCLLYVFADEKFPEDYTPTVFDNYNATIDINDRTLNFSLWDTAGQEDYDKIRPLSYPDTSVFLMCFSVENPTSYHNIKAKWAPEIAHHCPNVPIILVGTKLDLRENQKRINELALLNQKMVTTQEGQRLAAEIHAADYMECSARTNTNVKEVFRAAIKLHLSPKKETTGKKPNCLLL